MRESTRFGIDVSWALLGMAVPQVFGFILAIFLARWLGASDLGYYKMICIIYGIVTMTATLGMPVTLIKFSAEYKNDRIGLGELTTASLTIVFISALFSAVIMVLAAPFLSRAYDMPDLETPLTIAAVSLLFLAMFNTQIGLLNGLRRMKHFACLQIGHAMLKTGVIVAIVALGFRINGVMVGIVIAASTICILAFFISGRSFVLSWRNFGHNAIRLIPFGSKLMGADAINNVTSWADILMIGYYLASVEIGYYSVALYLIAPFLMIPLSFQRIIYPTAAEYLYDGRHEALQTMVTKATKYCTCIMLPVGMFFGLFAPEIISFLFGAEYRAAALPFRILLITRVIRGGVAVPIGGLLTVAERPDLIMKLAALVAGLDIVLNITLIPPFGINGAAVATAASLLIGAIATLVLTTKIVHVVIDLKWFGLLGIVVAGLILLFWIGSKWFSNWIVGGAIMALLLAIIVVAFLNQEDRTLIKGFVTSMLSEVGVYAWLDRNISGK